MQSFHLVEISVFLLGKVSPGAATSQCFICTGRELGLCLIGDLCHPHAKCSCWETQPTAGAWINPYSEIVLARKFHSSVLLM